MKYIDIYRYVDNVVAAALLGLMQIRPIIIASIVSNAIYVPVVWFSKR